MNKILITSVIGMSLSMSLFSATLNTSGYLNIKQCTKTTVYANQNIKKGYYELSRNNDNNARIYLSKARESLGIILKGCQFVMSPNGYKNKKIDYDNVEKKLLEIIERQKEKQNKKN